MSMPNNTPAPPRRAMLDAYTAMLLVAFLAITLGCVFLLMELNKYGVYPWYRVPR